MDDELDEIRDMFSIQNGDLGGDLIREYRSYYDDICLNRLCSRVEEDFEYESFTRWALDELLDHVNCYPYESTLNTIIAFGGYMDHMASIASNEKIRERFYVASECAALLFDYIIESVNT